MRTEVQVPNAIVTYASSNAVLGEGLCLRVLSILSERDNVSVPNRPQTGSWPETGF